MTAWSLIVVVVIFGTVGMNGDVTSSSSIRTTENIMSREACEATAQKLRTPDNHRGPIWIKAHCVLTHR